MSETQLSRSIRVALRQLGVWCIRVQAGIHRVRGGTLHCAERGTPDLCLPGLGWLEVKTEEGEPSPDQVAWHSRAAREGVNVAVVRSVEQAARVVRQWQAQQPRCLGCKMPFRSPDHDQRCSACVESGTGPEPLRSGQQPPLCADEKAT